jgi:hypothetical protein
VQLRGGKLTHRAADHVVCDCSDDASDD